MIYTYVKLPRGLRKCGVHCGRIGFTGLRPVLPKSQPESKLNPKKIFLKPYTGVKPDLKHYSKRFWLYVLGFVEM